MIWQEVMSSVHHKREPIRRIVSSILLVCIPITISSILSVATKSIDAVTVVRILSNQVGEQIAQVQYGILAGKIDMLVTLPFSFNIALRCSSGSGNSESDCSWEVVCSKKENRIFYFSNNIDRASVRYHYGCVFRTNIIDFVPECAITGVKYFL